MSVYVDDMRAPFGRMTMCHMIADSRNELDAMADRIGVARRWIQKSGTIFEHYDICLSKRSLAVKYGAQEIDMHRLAEIFRDKEAALLTHRSALDCPVSPGAGGAA